MEIIRPFTISDASLSASNISDTADYALHSLATVYVLGNRVIGTDHHEYESLSGTNKGAATITIASPGVVTSTAHGLVANTPVLFTTTGALPTGLAVNTVYYVRNPTTNTFEVSATSGGSSINTSGSQSGVHTLIANPNLNHALTDPAWWLDLGYDRRWRMFDQLNSSFSTNATTIDVSVQVTGRADSVALLNLVAATVRVVASTVADGTVYDETINLVSTSGINSWYDYFFEPIVRVGDVIISDLPLYVDPLVRVVLSEPGGTAECATMVVGQSLILGGTVYGARVGIQDYSRKVADGFGNFTIVERAFSKKATFKVAISGAKVDSIAALLSSLRATPVVYKGTDQYSSTYIYGFYKDWGIDISYPDVSYCTLDIEGLT